MEDRRVKTGRTLTVIEAAFEYFITLMISGTVLAKVTQFLGISDALTGILSAVSSLGWTLELVALFLAGKKPVKRWVTAGHIVNQCSFTLAFAVPLFPDAGIPKTVLFAAFLILGYMITSIIHAPKTNWFMGLVPEERRGVFTSLKESVSLVGGMIFSFVMGLLIDKKEAAGDVRGTFVLLTAVCFTLMLLHSLTLIFTVEKDDTGAGVSEKPGIQLMKSLLFDRRVLAVIGMNVLWNMAINVSTPFFGAYAVGALGLSLVQTSLINIAYSVARALVGPWLGRFGDRHSFVKLFRVSLYIAMAALVFMTFATPENGLVTYTLYTVIMGIALGGSGTSSLNLIYSEVEPSKRMSAFALQNCIVGLLSFSTTLVAGALVRRIQDNGNVFLGIHAYAQQIMSVLGILMFAAALCYNRFFLRPYLEKSGRSIPAQEKC